MPRRFSFTRLNLFQQPLLFAAISFICGIMLASGRRISVRAWLVFCALSWLLASMWLLKNRNSKPIIIFLLLGLFGAGGALWQINENNVSRDRVRRLFERGELKIDEPIEIWGTLNDAPELAPDRIFLSISVESVSTLKRQVKASGVVRVMVPLRDNDSRSEYDSLALDYGTRLRLLGFLSNRHGFRNPGAPDFDELLEYRGYDASGWVKSPLLIERLGTGKGNWLFSRLYRIRAQSLVIILRHFRQPASGILAAALFGNRYFLSRETAEVFRAGGTFHILVISGSHVAMIALSVLRLAKYLSNSRLIQHTLVLVLIWMYALMVGTQPAITRSVVMLTIALTGQLLFRTSAGVNTLSASAIVLLAWQPRDIFNPGFQLSFLTVLMIVAFTGPLYIRLKMIGQWQPSRLTPYPPRVADTIKRTAESLFWDEAGFHREMKESPIRYRVDKVRALNDLRCQKPLAWIAVTILTTTGVQAGLLPMMISQFHRVSLISPVTNVIEGAIVFALMLAGAGYLILYSIAGAITLKLAGAVNALGVFTVKSCEPLIAWRGANWRVPDFAGLSVPVSLFYLIGILALVIVINEWNPFRKGDEPEANKLRVVGRGLVLISALTVLILGWLLIAHPFSHEYERGRLSVTFMDVGQGDAMLISFPKGALMMIDAGGRPGYNDRQGFEENEEEFIEDRIGIGEAAVMPHLWHRGIRRLDWIVASHGDSDHVEGFSEIIPNFEIGLVLRGNPGSYPNSFDRVITQTRIPSRNIRRGDEFVIDGVRVDVLSPFSDSFKSSLSDNNGSVVIKITFGDRSFLLTGDIEREAEARLVDSDSDLRADVLKVAHHGSRTSTTSAFLERVKPQQAVISAAHPSPYGHPHPEVMARLREAGAQIWQTSACGAITISTDRHDLRVETFVKCE